MTTMKRTTINGEFEIVLPVHRAERPEWFTENGWEKKRLKKMHKEIKKGDVVYYVGVELGEMAALCQMWGAEVALFEPNYMAWPVIRAIWGANRLKKPLYIFAGFVSNKTQEIPTNPDKALFGGEGFIIDSNSGWPRYADAEIIKAHGFSELDKEADGLPQAKIDYLVFEKGLKPPSFLTFDCEGSEFEILRGAEETINKYKPKILASIHPEFLFAQYHEYSRNLRDWIIDHGYEETILDYQHELHTYYEPI